MGFDPQKWGLSPMGELILGGGGSLLKKGGS